MELPCVNKFTAQKAPIRCSKGTRADIVIPNPEVAGFYLQSERLVVRSKQQKRVVRHEHPVVRHRLLVLRVIFFHVMGDKNAPTFFVGCVEIARNPQFEIFASCRRGAGLFDESGVFGQHDGDASGARVSCLRSGKFRILAVFGSFFSLCRFRLDLPFGPGRLSEMQGGFSRQFACERVRMVFESHKLPLACVYSDSCTCVDMLYQFRVFGLGGQISAGQIPSVRDRSGTLFREGPLIPTIEIKQ